MSNEQALNKIQENPKLKEGIGLIMDAVSEMVEKITVENLANMYTTAGAVSILRGIISLFNTSNSPESLVEGLNNLLTSAGVEKVETKDNQLKPGVNTYQRVVDVYNDPEDPNTVTSLAPGYILHTDNGDMVLQYEDIKVNEAHYDNPIELFTKKSE